MCVRAQTERDVSVRQRAVDLLYAMCDRSNAKQIVAEMLSYLETADYSIREEIVSVCLLIFSFTLSSVSKVLCNVINMIFHASCVCLYKTVVKVVIRNESIVLQWYIQSEHQQSCLWSINHRRSKLCCISELKLHFFKSQPVDLPQVLKVAILAEKYAVDYTWYVDTILNLIRIAGDYVSEEVWYRVIQIVINRDDVQGYAAKTVFEVSLSLHD